MNDRVRRQIGGVQTRLKDGRLGVLRALEPEDSDKLASFYSSVPREDYRFYCPHPLTAERAQWKCRERAGADGFLCIVGELDGIAGYAWIEWDEDAAGEGVLGVCIGPSYQGSGLGRAILTRLLDVAGEFGPPVTTLTVQMANGRAQALYQSLGFEIFREQVRPAVEEFPAEPEFAMRRAQEPASR